MEKHRFKTAEFAALCGVKKDTLLHYDHIGLLKPQWVGENGYRYYSARQIPTYDLIATLRRLGTPLAEIRSYLTRRSPEALMDLLRGRESINDLSGPVGIVTAIGQAASYGWQDLLQMLALITVNLGIFNLLPFPALDGGKVVFLLIEGVTGHAVPEKIQSGLTLAAFALFFGLMLFATYNDILRLITGAV